MKISKIPIFDFSDTESIEKYRENVEIPKKISKIEIFSEKSRKHAWASVYHRRLQQDNYCSRHNEVPIFNLCKKEVKRRKETR